MGHRRWLSLALLAILTACAGNHGTLDGGKLPQPPAGGLLGLGSPAELARHAAFGDFSTVRQGFEYDQNIPSQGIFFDIDQPTALRMRALPGPPLTPVWAVYTFDLPGYDEEPMIKLTWTNKPLNNSVWLALANWDKNSWEFVA